MIFGVLNPLPAPGKKAKIRAFLTLNRVDLHITPAPPNINPGVGRSQGRGNVKRGRPFNFLSAGARTGTGEGKGLSHDELPSMT